MMINLLPEPRMSNGLKMSLTPQLRIDQSLRVYLAPLMTPVLRRSPDERPETDDEATPWRDAAGHRSRDRR
jgi:hypothetical protein